MRIKDIAEELKVSSTTISRVLNKKKGNYSKETEKRILDAIKKYNYTPNMIARNLKRKKTFDIGILIPEFSFYSEIYLGAQEVAKKQGYNVILACSNYKKDYELLALKDFLERKVEGLIVTTGFFNQSYLSEFAVNNIPVVALERISDKSELPIVYYDNYKIIKATIEHLIENGYKNPSLIIGSTDYLYNANERVKAFKKVLNENGLSFNENNILSSEKINYFDVNGSIELISSLIKNNNTDALLISKDLLAITMINKLIREGYKIPEDIGVVGFDNIEISRHIIPSLTCVDIPIFKFGGQAVKLLIKLINKKKVVKNAIEFEPKLVIRESTTRIKK